jgi:hypothetical protein
MPLDAGPALPAPTEERAIDGRWQPGQSGNPAGRPPSKRQSINALQQRLEEAVRSRLRPERVEKIVEKLCDLAEQGNVKAAQTILAYTITKPAAETDDAGKQPTGITIRIENATFKATQQQQQSTPKVIEGEYSEFREASTAD